MTTTTQCFGNGVHTSEMVEIYVSEKHGPRYMCTAHAEQQAASAVPRVPTVDEAKKIGTVLGASWGYDCTLVSYYEVVAATAKMVTVRPIEARHTEDGGKVPVPGKYVGDKTYKRRVMLGSRHLGPYVKVTDSQWAYVWSGQPGYETSN